MYYFVITSRATTGIKITLPVILRFVTPTGRHDSRINVKFGTVNAATFRCAKFHANLWIFRGF